MSRTIVKVFRSNKHLYSLVLSPATKQIIFSLSDQKLQGSKSERAKLLGNSLAKTLKEKKILEIVFDRNGYKFHGRIKIVADALKENGVII